MVRAYARRAFPRRVWSEPSVPRNGPHHASLSGEAGSDHLALAVAHLEPQDAGLVADKLLEAHDRGERVAALAMWYLREKINMRIDARGKPS